MVLPSVNGLGVWNILGQPLCHQFGEGPSALKNPPQLVGYLADGHSLLFHYIASEIILHWNRSIYPIISHIHCLLWWSKNRGGVETFSRLPNCQEEMPIDGQLVLCYNPFISDLSGVEKWGQALKPSR